MTIKILPAWIKIHLKKKKKKIIKEQTDAVTSETRSVKHKMSS